MPVPFEFQRATEEFYSYLVDARDTADLWSTHVTYTMTQSVFQVFRRRLSVQQSIAFANVLPVGLRALYVSDWDIEEEIRPFESIEKMTEEARMLRPDHNFSPDFAIASVAKALRRHVDEKSFEEVMKTLPEEASLFWNY